MCCRCGQAIPHRTAARSALLRQTLAGRPGLTRQARARTPGPGRAAARRPRRGNARRVARRVTSPPTTGLTTALRATGFGLVPHLEGYELPRFDTGWDANALPCGDRARPPSAARRDRRRPRQPIHDDRAANPTVLRTHAATRRATRRSRRASRRPTQLRRDPTLRSRLTEPTARPTPLNRRASDALRAFAPAQAAHPHALASKPSRGWSTFQPAQAGPSLNRP